MQQSKDTASKVRALRTDAARRPMGPRPSVAIVADLEGGHLIVRSVAGKIEIVKVGK